MVTMITLPILSIIVVNYNGRSFLADCLKSIDEHVSCPHEVIVVDNASTDGSCEYLREHFQQVHLIKSEKNLGFSGGNNLGATEARGKLLLLLNNDTRLISSLTPAIEALETDGQIGVLGCRMFYGDGALQPSIGFEITPLRIVLSWIGLGGFVFTPAIFKRVNNNERHYKVVQEVAWISGAFLMTRKLLWDQLGGMDEQYFMYVEEVDYCKRLRSHGYRISYTPHVQIVHYSSGGRAWVGESALISTMRSYLIFTKKHYGSLSLVCVRSGLGIVMLLRSAVYYLMRWVGQSQIYREKGQACLQAVKTLLGTDSPRK